jgi:hypothetical protein
MQLKIIFFGYRDKPDTQVGFDIPKTILQGFKRTNPLFWLITQASVAVDFIIVSENLELQSLKLYSVYDARLRNIKRSFRAFFIIRDAITIIITFIPGDRAAAILWQPWVIIAQVRIIRDTIAICIASTSIGAAGRLGHSGFFITGI